MNGSGRNPSASTTSVTPPRARRPTSREIIGRDRRGASVWARVLVADATGCRTQPTRTTARISYPWWCVRSGVASGTAFGAIVSPGTDEAGDEFCRGELAGVDLAERREVRRPRAAC